MVPSSRAWLDGEKAERPQAIDQARWETSAEGARRSNRSLAFAVEQLRHFPGLVAAHHAAGREDPPVQDITMRSRALDVVLRRISAQYGVSASDALLFSVCASLAELGRNDGCRLMLYASNRYSAMKNSALGTVVQDVPVAISTREPVGPALKKSAAVARAAYFHGRYAPPALRSLMHPPATSPSADGPDTSCSRNLQLSSASGHDPGTSCGDITAMRRETRVERTKWQACDRRGRRLYLVCSTVGDEVELILKVDTASLPVAAAESFLRELEDRCVHYSQLR